jgi:glycosyltransferase involved in cell wall biosynthesis
MPVYNGAATVRAAVESVAAQTFVDWECIIVDDGSTDDTRTILESWNDVRVRYIRHDQNAGVIERLNELVEKARAPYLARIDSDDRWSDPRKLEAQVSFLDAHSDHVLVGTQALFVRDGVGRPTHYPCADADVRQAILSKNVFVHSSCIFRKDAVPGLAYRPEDYLGEDYGLWLRLGMRGKLANLPEVMVEYLVNPAGETQQNLRKMTRRSLAIMKAYRGSYPGYLRAMLLWRLKMALRGMR